MFFSLDSKDQENNVEGWIVSSESCSFLLHRKLKLPWSVFPSSVMVSSKLSCDPRRLVALWTFTKVGDGGGEGEIAGAGMEQMSKGVSASKQSGVDLIGVTETSDKTCLLSSSP